MKKNLRFIFNEFPFIMFLDSLWKNRMVTGVVLDESKLPLAGVTFVVKGTTNGIVTNIVQTDTKALNIFQ